MDHQGFRFFKADSSHNWFKIPFGTDRQGIQFTFPDSSDGLGRRVASVDTEWRVELVGEEGERDEECIGGGRKGRREVL